MRVYLDSCVFQDIKKEEFNSLALAIKSHSNRNIYCFSEAHIFDLARDMTNNKHEDLAFLETIAENNCFYYKKGIQFEYYTPAEYYNLFDWSTAGIPSIFSNSDPIISSLYSALKTIPFNLKALVPEKSIPDGLLEEYRNLLNCSTTLYDFMTLMLDFTNEISEQQKKFKNLIKYLHENSFLLNYYELLGIQGYDGKNVVDKDKFKSSYSNYYLKICHEKNIYNLFIEMYNGLELLGIVKGKPKKQKMMNLINDARHAFFGAYCDIVVSKDEDFISKTKFMYDFLDIKIQVLSVTEFENLISDDQSKNETLPELLNEGAKNTNAILSINKTAYGEDIYNIGLDKIYWGCFDKVTYVYGDGYYYYFFSKQLNNYSTGTFIKEIKQCVAILVESLSIDLKGLGHFTSEEIVNEKWEGRIWHIGNTLITLNLDSKLFLSFFPQEYLDHLEKLQNN